MEAMREQDEKAERESKAEVQPDVLHEPDLEETAPSRGVVLKFSEEFVQRRFRIRLQGAACLRVASIAEADSPPSRKDAQEARATGSNTLTGRFVDAAQKEKSLLCAREFATNLDSTVFAAASDIVYTSLVDLISVKTATISCASMRWRHSPRLPRQGWSSFRLLTNM